MSFRPAQRGEIPIKLPYLLLLILLTGFVLRLYRLGADSLWYDETVSAFLAAESIPDLIAHTARDIHPPGYYMLLHVWASLTGHSEFALAFFSLIFGMLLIPLAYRLARRLTGAPTVAAWAALLVAVSPYNIWYSQEVRMYTLGATLGLVAAYCLWCGGIWRRGDPGGRHLRQGRRKAMPLLYWLGYALVATLGLYTLYYFAFLLLILNLIFLISHFSTSPRRTQLRPWLLSNGFILLVYLPWLPTLWRQATEPPVPSWRNAANLSLWSVLSESWSALSLGQSVDPLTVWPILLLTLALFILGLFPLNSSSPPRPLPPALLLVLYTFGPLLLIYLISFITPLYHVRYLFTYSPAFYIIVAAGLAWLTSRRWRWAALGAAGLLLAASLFSLYRYHFDSRYRADDYRSAVSFIQRRWQPGDVIIVNAGYVYTAFVYYNQWPDLSRQRLAPYPAPPVTESPLLLQTGTVDGSPQLGWGDPRSDFYAMSAAETVAALEVMSRNFSRLWLLRAYDTVTDPTGLIRTWLAEHTTPLEDQPFSGESNIRAQGFLLPSAQSPNFSVGSQTVEFEDSLALAGWFLPPQSWPAGQTIPVKLWWTATRQPSVDYKMSLKLWSESGQLMAQGQDTWPAGTLYRATAWPVGQTVYQPDSLQLPADLPPGQYWLNVELYHPDSGQPLPRLDGADPVVTLGPVLVER